MIGTKLALSQTHRISSNRQTICGFTDTFYNFKQSTTHTDTKKANKKMLTFKKSSNHCTPLPPNLRFSMRLQPQKQPTLVRLVARFYKLFVYLQLFGSNCLMPFTDKEIV